MTMTPDFRALALDLQSRLARQLAGLDEAARRLAHQGQLANPVSWWSEVARSLTVEEHPGQVRIVEYGGRYGGTQRSIRSAVNAARVALHNQDKMRQLLKGKIVDPETLKEMHYSTMTGILDEDRCGVFRTHLIQMRDPRVARNVATGSSPDLIRPELDAWAAGCSLAAMPDIHPVIRSAISHLEVNRIHPFPDGNGRTTRLLIAAIHAEQDYPALPYPLVFERDRQSYLANTTDALAAKDPIRYAAWHVEAMQRATEVAMAIEPGLEANAAKMARAAARAVDPEKAMSIARQFVVNPVTTTATLADRSRTKERDVHESLWQIEMASGASARHCAMGDISFFVNFDALAEIKLEMGRHLGPDLIAQAKAARGERREEPAADSKRARAGDDREI